MNKEEATNDNVFKNTLVDDTVEDDVLSQMLHDVESVFLMLDI